MVSAKFGLYRYSAVRAFWLAPGACESTAWVESTAGSELDIRIPKLKQTSALDGLGSTVSGTVATGANTAGRSPPWIGPRV